VLATWQSGTCSYHRDDDGDGDDNDNDGDVDNDDAWDNNLNRMEKTRDGNHLYQKSACMGYFLFGFISPQLRSTTDVERPAHHQLISQHQFDPRK
jgi:hypothetical protein